MEKRWWNDRKIERYERASIYCDFHTLLSKEIQSILNKDESIVEFGSGLGYVSEILSKQGYNISSFDIDNEVIERAKERSGLDIYHTSDYRESDAIGDVVLLIFFGRLWLDDILSSLFSHAKKRIISIHSLHSGQNNRLVSRNTPSLSESLTYLEKKGYKVKGKELYIPFPQPLKSLEEAQLFIKENYPGKDTYLYMKYILENNDDNYPFILPNEKRMVMLNIEK